MSKRYLAEWRITIFVSLFVLLITGCTSEPTGAWHMINVNHDRNQGDANLIQVGGKNVMIDAGYYDEAKQEVVPYLEKLNVKHIDHFFISHPHRDHYEGLRAIMEAKITIDKLYFKIPKPEAVDCCYNKKHFLSYLQYAENRGATLIETSTGFVLPLPHDSELEILHAQEGNLPQTVLDINDMSLIMMWRINGFSVLFPGDLNFKLGAHLSDDERMQADFMKMPHHGGRSLAPNRFFERVDPRYVLVPGPKWVWCGERGKRPREWVANKKLPTWVNGINGNVSVNFESDQITITPETVSAECKLKAFGKMLVKTNVR